MSDRPATLRVRAVRFKAGGEVRMMRGDQNKDAAHAMDAARRVIATHLSSSGGIAGFAFVVWDEFGASTCKMHVENGKPFPSMLAPEFVKNRLLADRIETWTLESIFPPAPPKPGA